MAGSKLTGQPKLKGSTILEVVISMVVIMVVFGIAMMIFANVMRTSLSAKKIRAEAVLNDALLKCESSNGITSQTFTDGDLRLEQAVKSFNDAKNLVEIDLTVYDSNQEKIMELQKVIINKNE